MANKRIPLTDAQAKFVTFVFSLTGLSYIAAGAALLLIPGGSCKT